MWGRHHRTKKYLGVPMSYFCARSAQKYAGKLLYAGNAPKYKRFLVIFGSCILVPFSGRVLLAFLARCLVAFSAFRGAQFLEPSLFMRQQDLPGSFTSRFFYVHFTNSLRVCSSLRFLLSSKCFKNMFISFRCHYRQV